MALQRVIGSPRSPVVRIATATWRHARPIAAGDVRNSRREYSTEYDTTGYRFCAAFDAKKTAEYTASSGDGCKYDSMKFDGRSIVVRRRIAVEYKSNRSCNHHIFNPTARTDPNRKQHTYSQIATYTVPHAPTFEPGDFDL